MRQAGAANDLTFIAFNANGRELPIWQQIATSANPHLHFEVLPHCRFSNASLKEFVPKLVSTGPVISAD
jgi:hypothetical protein